MILESVRGARAVLVRDSLERSALPALLEALVGEAGRAGALRLLCCERPAPAWRALLARRARAPLAALHCHEPDSLAALTALTTNSAVLIDSFNQLVLSIGAQQSFQCVQELLSNSYVTKLVVVFHSDCVQKSSKLQALLEHMSQLTILSIRNNDETKLRLSMYHKKGGKQLKVTEDIWYNTDHGCYRCEPVSKHQQRTDEPGELLPHNLTTFKIGLENKEKKAKDELELPYLIKKETSKVYYEHDAGDDWDDEDPDEDLDI